MPADSDNSETDDRVVDQAHQTYTAERKTTVESESSEYASFDKWVITLAAGAFGLSVTFFRDIAPDPIPETLWKAKCAWASLVASMVLTLASFQMGARSHRRYVEILDAQFRSIRDGTECTPDSQYNGWSLAVGVANVLSLVTFIAGVGLLAWFCVSNVGFPEQ